MLIYLNEITLVAKFKDTRSLLIPIQQLTIIFIFLKMHYIIWFIHINMNLLSNTIIKVIQRKKNPLPDKVIPMNQIEDSMNNVIRFQ